MTSTATALAMAVAAEPPPGLKARVLAAAAATPQLPPLPAAAAAGRRRASVHPLGLVSPARPRGGRGRRGGGGGARGRDRLHPGSARSPADAEPGDRGRAAVPDAQIASAAGSKGGAATVVLSYAEQKMIFTSTGLPPLPNNEVYELWLLSTGSAQSAGLLPEPTGGKPPPARGRADVGRQGGSDRQARWRNQQPDDHPHPGDDPAGLAFPSFATCSWVFHPSQAVGRARAESGQLNPASGTWSPAAVNGDGADRGVMVPPDRVSADGQTRIHRGVALARRRPALAPMESVR